MFKPPKFIEMNSCPERLNTSSATGAMSQLSNSLQDPPSYDGVTIADMKDNPLYSRADTIDKIGIAQEKIVKATKAVKSKSKLIRGLNDLSQKMSIPKDKK